MSTASDAPPLLSRPLLGGLFGPDGRYALASVPVVTRGLHSVKYLVLERAGAVLAIAEDKTEALASARRLLTAAGEIAPRLLAANDPHAQAELWAPDDLPPIAPVASPGKQIPRRRREVFDRSQGKCHYCATPLTLDGQWHVEHMLPRALGGTEDRLNLVAACTSCNLRKSDQSAVEFIAGQRRG